MRSGGRDRKGGGHSMVVSPEEVIVQLSPKVMVGRRTAYA